jgi:hypothetical protein
LLRIDIASRQAMPLSPRIDTNLELDIATALRKTLPEFLLESSAASVFKKSLRDNIDPDHARPLRLSE